MVRVSSKLDAIAYFFAPLLLEGHYPLEVLATISKKKPTQAVRWGLKRDEEGWHAAAA